MHQAHRIWPLLVAFSLASCGIVDELSSPEAANWCDFPLGGEAARVEVQRSRDEDGRIELTVSKYDAHDSLILTAVDWGDDERFEQLGTRFEQLDTMRYGYHESGDWTWREYDFGSDDVLEERAYQAFDSDGNLVDAGLDADGDGDWDWVRTTDYDDGRWVSTATDDDGDGDWESLAGITYDDEGRTLSHSYDDDADGAPESVTDYVYDDSGGYSWSEDQTNDGVPERMGRHFYSADGTEYTTEVDEGADGVVDFSTRTTFDDQKRETEFASDSDQDGAFDSIKRTTYTESGALQEETTDENGDGQAEVATTYTYDDQGRPLTVETWTSSDVALGRIRGGPWASVTSYVYDGPRSTRTFRHYSAGLLDRACTETTVAGDPVELRCDYQGDGREDSITTYVTCN
jgi:hypothetical protein